MPTRTSDDLLYDLRRLRLVPADRLASADADGVAGWPADRLAGWLRDAGLTAFQVRRLLAGRADSLRFGPYLLLDKLGEGGMGVVYRAWHGKARRVDAVKVIRPDRLASKTVGRRFLREIQLTSGLSHPHLVRAVGAGEIDGRWFLATECVRGHDLGAVVRHKGPLPPAEAVRAVAEAAAALQYTHERGLVHRDVKPSNLVREKVTGETKLLDLGLSGTRPGTGAGGAAVTLTVAGIMLGTPDYMAPEQATDPHGVDSRADLYSLGCTFVFLLTGRPPFAGSALDKLMAHAAAPVPPVVLPDGSSPPGLVAVVNRLLAKKPADRFQTPRELIHALDGLRFAARVAGAAVAVPVDGSAETLTNDRSSDFDEFTQPPAVPGGGGRRFLWAVAGLAAAVVAGLAAAVVIWG